MVILSHLFVTTLQGQGRVLIPRSCLPKLLVWVLYIVKSDLESKSDMGWEFFQSTVFSWVQEGEHPIPFGSSKFHAQDQGVICIPILAYYQQKNKPEFSNNKNCQRQEHMPVLLAPERLRQEDLNSRTAWTEDSLLFLGYESSL